MQVLCLQKRFEQQVSSRLSKWSRLLLTSPRASAGGYGWKDTAAHEYIHLVVSYLSDDHAPVWLQEGLAKYFEGVGEEIQTVIYRLFNRVSWQKPYKTTHLFLLKSFAIPWLIWIQLKKLLLAYAQVSSMVSFSVKRAVLDAFPTLLSRVQQEEDPMFVMADLAGYTSFEDFRRDWKAVFEKAASYQR